MQSKDPAATQGGTTVNGYFDDTQNWSSNQLMTRLLMLQVTVLSFPILCALCESLRDLRG
jgi:hypothetical protein